MRSIRGWREWGKRRRRGAMVSAGVEESRALFRSENFLDFDTVALSFLFDKHCPIIQ